ncbi:MAG: pectinesterase family protein [Clostridiales bacterium]|nr:pectinesterase family protein [Clostridiales bacterium]
MSKWCQINPGTILYVPVVSGSVLTIGSFFDSNTNCTIGDTTYEYSTSDRTYTVSSSDTLVSLDTLDSSSDFTSADDTTFIAITFGGTSGSSYFSTISVDNSGVSSGSSSGTTTTVLSGNKTWNFGYTTGGEALNMGTSAAGWIFKDGDDWAVDSIYVNTGNSGKLYNYTDESTYRSSDVQINAYTKLYIPAQEGTTLTITNYSNSTYAMTYSLGATLTGISATSKEYQVKSADLVNIEDEESDQESKSVQYVVLECTTSGYFVSIYADYDTTLTEKDETPYTLTGEITCDDSVDITGAELTFTDMDDPTYVYTYTAEEAGISSGSTTYSVSIPAGDYNTSVSGVSGYITNDRVCVADSADGTTNEIYLETDDSVVTTYTLYDEIQSESSLEFSSFSAHSSLTVAGKAGATVTVPVSSGKTVVVNGYYDGEFTITGSSGNGTAADSGDTLTATYYTVDGDEYVTITITATGNVASGSSSAYLNTVVISTTPETVAFTSSIDVPGDFDTVTEAISAIKSMDRESGEAGRVTINLKSDLQEQVVVDTDYVTINGNGYEINWYYGVICKYYSVDSNGYYSESLFRDKYEKTDTNGYFWGGVVIVTGDYFKAENVTFKNTFNYEVTQKELDDGVEQGSNDCSIIYQERTTKGTGVADLYSQKERANALAISGNYAESYNCSILSSQDTLGWNGEVDNYTYFKDCTIGGNVDYICGAGTMLFDDCTLQWYVQTDQSSSLGYITAPKTKPYIFRNCKITAADKDGNTSSTNLQGYYGRTWGTGSTAYFIGCETNGLINNTGWGEMSANQFDSAVFYEYGNTSSGKAFETGDSYSFTHSGTTYTYTKDTVLANSDSELESVINDDVISGCLGSWKPDYYESKFAANVFGYSAVVTGSDELLVHGNLPSAYTDDIAKVGLYFITDSAKTDFDNLSSAIDSSEVVYSTITFGTDENIYSDSNGYVYGAVISDISSYSDTIYVYTYVTTTGGDTLYSTGTKLDYSVS